MRALALVALIALATGCAPRPSPSVTACYWAKLAHPTMTPDDIAFGIDARVRAGSEGGYVPSGAPSTGPTSSSLR
jgi:hypothetical protein